MGREEAIATDSNHRVSYKTTLAGLSEEHVTSQWSQEGPPFAMQLKTDTACFPPLYRKFNLNQHTLFKKHSLNFYLESFFKTNTGVFSMAKANL